MRNVIKLNQIIISLNKIYASFFFDDFVLFIGRLIAVLINRPQRFINRIMYSEMSVCIHSLIVICRRVSFTSIEEEAEELHTQGSQGSASLFGHFQEYFSEESSLQ